MRLFNDYLNILWFLFRKNKKRPIESFQSGEHSSPQPAVDAFSGLPSPLISPVKATCPPSGNGPSSKRPSSPVEITDSLLEIAGGLENLDINSSIVPSEVETLERPPLWALIIGINDYAHIRKLKGAVPDADAVKRYLETELKIPPSQILNLRDRQATRSAIISALEALKNNRAIKRDDPILIYFAGHGGEVTQGLDKTQTLIPVDFVPERSNEADKSLLSELMDPMSRDTTGLPAASPMEKIRPIPDRTVASLINSIAGKHGNNITVVLDCCHSGSGTRGDNDISDEEILAIRGGGLLARDIPWDLDVDIVESDDGSRGLRHAKGFAQKGMDSHVLLAGCSADERAREDRNGPEAHGRFTTALLQLLSNVSPDQMTYAEALTRIPLITGQNPQCEGLNKHRIMFDAKVCPPSRKCYGVEVHRRKGIILKAGKAHGITDGAEFTLYKSKDDVPDSPLGIMVAKDGNIDAFTTLLKPIDASKTQVQGPTVAIQTKAGSMEDLKIYIPPKEEYLPVFEALSRELNGTGLNPCRIELEPDRGKAKLEIVAVVDNQFALVALDNWAREHKFDQLPFRVDADDLNRVLRAAAHYYHHLCVNHENNRIQAEITIEFFALKEDEEVDTMYQDDPILVPHGPNLLQGSGKIEYEVAEGDEAKYGMKITNNTPFDLYFVCLYFDHTDLSITPLTEVDSEMTHQRDFPLKSKGTAEMGYGSLGIPPLEVTVSEDLDLMLGFLKFYFTSEVIDLTKVPQSSPFVLDRGLKQASPARQKPVWGTVLIPVIQRRID